MTAISWITFAVITGTVWGGFMALLALALRKESKKDDF
jgi:hypothetical protein